MKTKITGSKGNIYEIDTEKITCNCPQFKFKTKHYEIGNSKRLCKHLQKIFSETPEFKPASISIPDSIKTTGEIGNDGLTRYPKQMYDKYVSELRTLFNQIPSIKKYEFCDYYKTSKEKITNLNILILSENLNTSEIIFNYCEDLFKYEKIFRKQNKAVYKIENYLQINFKIEII